MDKKQKLKKIIKVGQLRAIFKLNRYKWKLKGFNWVRNNRIIYKL